MSDEQEQMLEHSGEFIDNVGFKTKFYFHFN